METDKSGGKIVFNLNDPDNNNKCEPRELYRNTVNILINTTLNYILAIRSISMIGK